MEYTVVEVPVTQYESGGHDCTTVFHPASWAHFPISEASNWWSKIPVRWPIVTHEYGQVSNKNFLSLDILLISLFPGGAWSYGQSVKEYVDKCTQPAEGLSLVPLGFCQFVQNTEEQDAAN